MTTRPERAVPGRGRTWLQRTLALVVFVAALVFLQRSLGGGGWHEVIERLMAARPGWLALALVTTLCAYLTWGLRWRAIIRPVHRVPLLPAQRALMASVFINTVIPFARSLGGLVRARYLSKSCNVPMASVYGPTVIDQIGYSTVSLTLGALCIPFALWSGGSSWRRVAVALLLGGVVLTAAIVILRSRRALIMQWIRGRMPGAATSVETAVRSAQRALVRPTTWPVIAGGGALVWFFNVLTFWIAGRATGSPFGLGAAAAAWSLGSIVGIGSGTPGGIGTTESAAILPLIGEGVPAAHALAAILLARLIQYSTAILIGGVCFVAGAGKTRSGPLAKDF